LNDDDDDDDDGDENKPVWPQGRGRPLEGQDVSTSITLTHH
jgi:hypothetical protein